MERLTGWKVGTAYCDRGYQGVPRELAGTTVQICRGRKKRMTRTAWKWVKRRAAVEPTIGHLKGDHRMGRNHLKGEAGDRMNALLAGCGYNLRKLLRELYWLVFGVLAGLKSPEEASTERRTWLERVLETWRPFGSWSPTQAG